mmetsp:Transcript_30081/g.58890  ORF Transcript_30081/g.58890 Transcript_30081/m.58890 type:complete len:268 (+) Transcript_30081:451-1254(+)
MRANANTPPIISNCSHPKTRRACSSFSRMSSMSLSRFPLTYGVAFAIALRSPKPFSFFSSGTLGLLDLSSDTEPMEALEFESESTEPLDSESPTKFWDDSPEPLTPKEEPAESPFSRPSESSEIRLGSDCIVNGSWSWQALCKRGRVESLMQLIDAMSFSAPSFLGTIFAIVIGNKSAFSCTPMGTLARLHAKSSHMLPPSPTQHTFSLPHSSSPLRWRVKPLPPRRFPPSLVLLLVPSLALVLPLVPMSRVFGGGTQRSHRSSALK